MEVLSDLEALEDLALRLGSGVLALRLGLEDLMALEALGPPSLVLSFSAKIIKEQLIRISLNNQPHPTQELLPTHTPGSKRPLNFITINYDRLVEKTKKGAAAPAPLII
ncbi:hypothetical protein ACI48J_24825 [Paenibacillus chitinolyticus]|uniref:hypothetical protein n=1 Tax=Paenibacillus chitinolyticus TaxID=79263 RepID=UPI003868B7C0